MDVRTEKQPVPRRALAISLAALVVPVAVAFWWPDWESNSFGMLVWLTVLIPAFLLSYYRGLAGVAIALAGGMAVITATQVSIVAFQIAEPNWTLLIIIVAVYLTISMGIAGLAEVLRRERRAAEELALEDRLTGLPNRRHADMVLDREFAAAERGCRLAVVIFDLDRFKQVNDRHGHGAGDMTLKMFANVLRTNTRKENLSARYGGEEFVSILRDATPQAALIYAQRVLDQTRDSPLPWGKQTVSAGIAVHQPGMGSHELLVAAAYRALYEAKTGGRDMVCVAEPQEARPSVAARRVSVTTSPEAVPTPAPARVPGGAPSPAATTAGVSIYMVDDDSAVRSVLKRMLVANGCKVWDTGDPVEAIRKFETAAPSERPDLILTDVIMPAMTGMRMIDQIVHIEPAVRVVYMSGYVQSKISWGGTPGAVVAFLEKPIRMESLLATIEGIMQRDPNASGVAPNPPVDATSAAP